MRVPFTVVEPIKAARPFNKGPWSSGAAGPITLTLTADATYTQDVYLLYGADFHTVLEVDGAPAFELWYDGVTPDILHLCMTFTGAEALAGKTITSANLTLYNKSGPNAGLSTYTSKIQDTSDTPAVPSTSNVPTSWTSGEAKINTANPAVDAAVTWLVTAAVQTLANRAGWINGRVNAGVVVASAEFPEWIFHASNAASNLRPKLVVVYT